MENDIFFNQFVTKSLHPIDGAQRFFEGYLTVQVKDKQGEITIVDELIKVLPIWMDRGAPISDTHSNRIIGKGISYAKTIYKSAEGVEYPAIKITGKIHKDYHLDNEIWDKIKTGEYKGLSFGGATKANRTPKVMKDGSVAYELKSLEHYEVAVCKDPAVPLALITDYNPLAKAITDNVERREDGKMVIKCDKFGCTVNKDSLIKVEDEDDDNTEVEVLDEWKNDDNDNGEEKKKGEDFSNADGDKHGAYNQNVSPEKSSNRESSPVDDDDDVEIKAEEKEKADFQQNGSDIRHSGKEYQTNNESAQVTEVKEDKDDEDVYKKIRKALLEIEHEKKVKSTRAARGGNMNSGTTLRPSDIKELQDLDTDKEEAIPTSETKYFGANGKRITREEHESGLSKSGYQTEDGNQQAGGQGSTKDDTYKNSENYINSENEDSDKDMDKDTSNNHSEEEQSSEEEKDDEVEKSDFQEAIKSNISTLTDVIKSLAETQKDVSNTLVGIDDRLKALETPTDLPLKPQTSASEDVGAKVTTPDTYQSNSIQAGLDDDKSGEKKPETDPSGLKMQEKANFDFTTETPRPNAAIETVNKSEGDISMILKDARSGGDLSAVARNILAGKYYTPTPDEVGTY